MALAAHCYINIPSPYKFEVIKKPHYHHHNNALASFGTGKPSMLTKSLPA